MIQPGRDTNYPTSSGSVMAYAPHGLLGLGIVAVVALILIHALSKGRRR